MNWNRLPENRPIRDQRDWLPATDWGQTEVFVGERREQGRRLIAGRFCRMTFGAVLLEKRQTALLLGRQVAPVEGRTEFLHLRGSLERGNGPITFSRKELSGPSEHENFATYNFLMFNGKIDPGFPGKPLQNRLSLVRKIAFGEMLLHVSWLLPSDQIPIIKWQNVCRHLFLQDAPVAEDGAGAATAAHPSAQKAAEKTEAPPWAPC